MDPLVRKYPSSSSDVERATDAGSQDSVREAFPQLVCTLL